MAIKINTPLGLKNADFVWKCVAFHEDMMTALRMFVDMVEGDRILVKSEDRAELLVAFAAANDVLDRAERHTVPERWSKEEGL